MLGRAQFYKAAGWLPSDMGVEMEVSQKFGRIKTITKLSW